MSYSHLEREDRIKQLVALCVKNNRTPRQTGFADLIHQLSATRFFVVKATATGYLHTLIQAWRMDKWRTFVKDNSYLTVEEKTEWSEKNHENP